MSSVPVALRIPLVPLLAVSCVTMNHQVIVAGGVASAETQTSAHASAADAAHPSSPRQVRARARKHRNGDKYPLVTWQSPKHRGTSRISAYRVFVLIPNSSPRTRPASCHRRGYSAVVKHRYCAAGESGEHMRFAVQARNASGWGPQSKFSNAITIYPGAA